MPFYFWHLYYTTLSQLTLGISSVFFADPILELLKLELNNVLSYALFPGNTGNSNLTQKTHWNFKWMMLNGMDERLRLESNSCSHICRDLLCCSTTICKIHFLFEQLFVFQNICLNIIFLSKWFLSDTFWYIWKVGWS